MMTGVSTARAGSRNDLQRPMEPRKGIPMGRRLFRAIKTMVCPVHRQRRARAGLSSNADARSAPHPACSDGIDNCDGSPEWGVYIETKRGRQAMDAAAADSHIFHRRKPSSNGRPELEYFFFLVPIQATGGILFYYRLQTHVLRASLTDSTTSGPPRAVRTQAYPVLPDRPKPWPGLPGPTRRAPEAARKTPFAAIDPRSRPV